MMTPTLTYDRDANALYIRFSTNAIAETLELPNTAALRHLLASGTS